MKLTEEQRAHLRGWWSTYVLLAYIVLHVSAILIAAALMRP